MEKRRPYPVSSKSLQSKLAQDDHEWAAPLDLRRLKVIAWQYKRKEADSPPNNTLLFPS